jgi:hypothetical protein
MPIKTTSLKTSQMLKENGFRQENIENWWDVVGENERYRLKRANDMDFGYINQKSGEYYWQYAAPTTDELLEEIDNDAISEYAESEDINDWGSIVDLIRDPDKLAECWLYLKLKGLLKEK